MIDANQIKKTETYKKGTPNKSDELEKIKISGTFSITKSDKDRTTNFCS